MADLLIKNGTIIDVEQARIFKGAIEVRGKKIYKLIPDGDQLPNNIEIFDASGKYIIPGLIDMHCHLHEGFAKHFVAAGVTTVRNTAGNIIFLNELREKYVDEPFPKIYGSDRMIDGWPGQWGETSYGNFVTDCPKAARKEVRRQANAGAYFIKLYGWIKEDVLIAATEEAKQLGLEVAIDLINSKDLTILDAAKAGVNWIEHASGFAQALYKGWNPMANQENWQTIDWENPDEGKIKDICAALLQSGVKLCPTMVLFDQTMKFPSYWSPQHPVINSINERAFPLTYWQEQEELISIVQKNNAIINTLTKKVAKTYFDMGGVVVAGTDTPALLYTYPGMALHRELEIFVEIGFSEMEALQAATSHAAKAMKQTEIGSIKENAFADLLILSKNPLDDIKHTQEIDYIVQDGKFYRPKEILRELPSLEEANKTMNRFIEKWDMHHS